MDIIVKGRHTDVSDRFREHVDTKLAKIERLDQKVIRVDVEVSEDRNHRQADQRERVELTIRSKGPAIRAEAAADDRYAALDLATEKLEARLRRTGDRRKHHGNRRTAEKIINDVDVSLALGGDNGTGFDEATESARVLLDDPDAFTPRTSTSSKSSRSGEAETDANLVPIPMDGDGPLIVREKFHEAAPMDIEQALLEMELVGHDFFLFRDTACGKPSVVYRRRGWDYGVIRLVEE